MILYLSSGIEKNIFSDYFGKGLVGSSLQAQRFNSLVIEGLGHITQIAAIGHPEYTANSGPMPDVIKNIGETTFYIIGKKESRLRKWNNFRHLYKICKTIIRKNNIDAVICDAISPLYSLMARLLSKRFSIPSVAIVTDIPIIMEANHITVLTNFSQFLMQKHDGYVLLTEAMNDLVNPKKRPHIVMEGICDVQTVTDDTDKNENEIITCLYTGSLSVQTGILNLIEAFNKLKGNNIELHVYGKGPAEDIVTEASNNNKHITYGGLVTNEDAARLQRQADILINPRPANIGYAAYSFPSKVMEYMASGTPVLTTCLSGIPEEYFKYVLTINDDSVNGIYESLQAVLTMDRVERDAKGKTAQKFVLEKKNNVAQGGRILELINHIRGNA